MALGLVVLTGLAVWTLKPEFGEPSLPVSRMTFAPSAGAQVDVAGPNHNLTISADGTSVVYETNESLLVRALDQLNGAPLGGTPAAVSPFLSPDGAWVGFTRGNTLQRMSIQGGPAVTICPLPADLRGASWGDDDGIVFGLGGTEGLFRVSAQGGEPERVTTSGGASHRWPDVLPDGRGVLFATGSGGDYQIAVLDPATGDHDVIIPNGTHPRYAMSGHIVYGLEGTLRAVAFDLDTRRVSGEPFPVVDNVITKPSGAANFDLAATGSLVYVRRGGGATSSLVWVDRRGREEAVKLPPGVYRDPRLSPDGKRLAVAVADGGTRALWVYDLANGSGLRFTHEGRAVAPVWAPNGEHVVFGWDIAGSTDLYRVRADGSSDVESLTTSDGTDVPSSVTPDGESVLFTRVSGGQRGTWEVSLDEDRTPRPVLSEEVDLSGADVSPDGNWVAYRSTRSGQAEVLLRPYPGPGPPVPVSIGGGDMVTWAQDSSELFYRTGGRVMAVPVSASGTVSAPTELVAGDYVSGEGQTSTRQYHVGPDGRFIMLKRAGAATDGPGGPQIVLVQNWFSELERLDPTN